MLYQLQAETLPGGGKVCVSVCLACSKTLSEKAVQRVFESNSNYGSMYLLRLSALPLPLLSSATFVFRQFWL